MDLLESRQDKNILTSGRHPWEKARLHIAIQFIKKYTSPDEELIILDIGCGDGYILEGIAAYFKKGKFIGIDSGFDDYMPGKVNGSGVDDVHYFTSLDQVPARYIASGVSFILLMDVLEHIENDTLFFQELYQQPAMSEKTLFFITVPSYQCLFNSHDVFLKHFRRHTTRSLINAIQVKKKDIISSGYFFISLLPFRLFDVILKTRAFTGKSGIASDLNWDHGNFLSNMLKSVLILDFKAGQLLNTFGIKLPGLSNYVLCKKPV